MIPDMCFIESRNVPDLLHDARPFADGSIARLPCAIQLKAAVCLHGP